MAHFRGIVIGKAASRNATRIGNKENGIEVVVQSVAADVRVRMSHRDGQDFVEVCATQHGGGSTIRTLYTGPIAGLLHG